MVKSTKRNVNKKNKKSVKRRSKKAGDKYRVKPFKESLTFFPPQEELNNNIELNTGITKYDTQQDYINAYNKYIETNPTPEEEDIWKKTNKGPLHGNLVKVANYITTIGRRSREKILDDILTLLNNRGGINDIPNIREKSKPLMIEFNKSSGPIRKKQYDVIDKYFTYNNDVSLFHKDIVKKFKEEVNKTRLVNIGGKRKTRKSRKSRKSRRTRRTRRR